MLRNDYNKLYSIYYTHTIHDIKYTIRLKSIYYVNTWFYTEKYMFQIYNPNFIHECIFKYELIFKANNIKMIY